VQPRTRTAAGGLRWDEAVVLATAAAPTEARRAYLGQSFRPGQVHRAALDAREIASLDVNGGTTGREQSIQATFSERTLAVTPTGDGGQVRLQYRDVKFSDSDADNAFRKQLGPVLDAFKQLAVEASVAPDGRYQSPAPDFASVPVAARPTVQRFLQQILDGLDALALGLPNKAVPAGHTWEADRLCTIVASPTPRPALLRLRYEYKYVGTRTRAGREEAVIEVTGTVAPDAAGPGGNAPLRGTARGAAAVDLQTGRAVLARLEAEVTTELPFGGGAAPAAVYLEWLLRCGVDGGDPPAAADADTFLPNRTIILRPVVPVR
jgi:hypothetical protein